MINILFAAGTQRWPAYEAPLTAALHDTGLAFNLSPDHTPDVTDYIVYASDADLQDFSPYTRTKLVQNTWAGVENLVKNPTLTQPLARMVDHGLTDGMVEWVTAHTLRYHLGIDAHIVNPDHVWRQVPPPIARMRKVAVLGLGALGTACAQALSSLNFNVLGWSRRQKDIPGILCRSGKDGLRTTLAEAEIVITILPLTGETENLLDAAALALMPRGAFVINPGRGPLIDDDALLAALDDGHIAGATLDVFRTEPLPQSHAYWAHPGVTVTPHIAADTRPETASLVVAENIRLVEAGQPPRFLVDRTTGY